MYLPGFPSIAKDLNTGISNVALTLSSYFIGISLGQLIYGPLLDRFGRKKPLIIGFALYFLAALFCGFVSDINGLIILRFILALGGCAGMVASRAIIRDICRKDETVNAFAMLMLVMGVTPIIAPSLGGMISSYPGWRFIFFLLSFISLILLLMIIFLLPETKQSDSSVSMKIKPILLEYLNVLKEPSFLIYGIAGGIAYSALFSYISGASFVYMNLFGFTGFQFGVIFGINAFGLISGGQLNRLIHRKYKSGSIVLIMQAVLIILCLMMTAFNIFFQNITAITVVLLFLFLFSLGILNPNTNALGLHPFTRNAGIASALLGFVQMVTSALASGLISLFHNNTVFPMILIMTVLIVISFTIVITGRLMNAVTE
jgi:MFS transporter, DHA1 family, multidrug resistance protein